MNSAPRHASHCLKEGAASVSAGPPLCQRLPASSRTLAMRAARSVCRSCSSLVPLAYRWCALRGCRLPALYLRCRRFRSTGRFFLARLPDAPAILFSALCSCKACLTNLLNPAGSVRLALFPQFRRPVRWLRRGADHAVGDRVFNRIGWRHGASSDASRLGRAFSGGTLWRRALAHLLLARCSSGLSFLAGVLLSTWTGRRQDGRLYKRRHFFSI